MNLSTQNNNHVRRRAVLALSVLLAVFADSLLRGASATDDAPDGSDGGVEAEIKVSVMYATNRRLEGDGTTLGTYGGERGKPSFGRCEVTFKPIPIINRYAPRVSFYIPAETSKVRFTQQSDTEVFWERLSAEVARSASKSVVVFVHGYNYGFERHCRKAAELQRTLQGKVTVLMFSWPSNGRPSDYVPDQADVEWSVPFLAKVLTRLGERVGRSSVQVLAHSLGSRGVIYALERLNAEQDQRPVIGPLILMAPDYDAQTFVDRLPTLASLTTSITLYASSNDTPLKVSRQLHGSPRLGEAGEFLTVAEGLQTVDVSSLKRYRVMGHEYFLFHPRVAADLATLLIDGRGAAEREGTRAVRRNGQVYWELVGDPPKSGDDAEQRSVLDEEEGSVLSH